MAYELKNPKLLHKQVASKGGSVKGPCKRRGDSEYYRQIALKRWSKKSK